MITTTSTHMLGAHVQWVVKLFERRVYFRRTQTETVASKQLRDNVVEKFLFLFFPLDLYRFLLIKKRNEGVEIHVDSF